MPAETDLHERTLMAWPTELRRPFWEGHLEQARAAWAEVARSIARFEPVTMVVDVGELSTAEVELGTVPGIELVELPIDDSWMRDSGPIVVSAPGDPAERRAVQFGFNAWGELVGPFDRDAVAATAVAGHLGLPVLTAPFVLEGGAVAVDGDGLLVTTERCLLDPNRGPLPGGETRTMDRLEELLGEWLGVQRVVWLRDGLEHDTDTDGHVDNVVALPGPGMALLQGCDDPDDPDAATAADSRRRLEAAGLEVVELELLPRTSCFDEEVEVPYANLYAGNGFVVVPVAGHAYDDEAIEIIGALYPGREVVPVPGEVIAFGGGGPHCITQQVPAG
jgi:agmatine deiminase